MIAAAEAEVALALAEVLDADLGSESQIAGRRDDVRRRLYEQEVQPT